MSRVFKLVGDHLECLDSGLMLGVCETVELTPEEQKEPAAARLIGNGKLIPVAPAHDKAGKGSRNTEGDEA